eukprot:scaffold8444_cov56-Cylindrotheca_fusiformis.AAC.5
MIARYANEIGDHLQLHSTLCYVRVNKVSGTIPISEIGNLRKLCYLYLGGNIGLTGTTIPMEVGHGSGATGVDYVCVYLQETSSLTEELDDLAFCKKKLSPCGSDLSPFADCGGLNPKITLDNVFYYFLLDHSEGGGDSESSSNPF